MNFESKYGVINYHNTPWNDKALNGLSLEIDTITATESNSVNLIAEFCSQKASENYVLIASRVSASSGLLKKIHYQSGFVTVEHTLEVSSAGMSMEKIELLANKFPVVVENYSERDIPQLEEIAAFEFKHGRFYEDPFIDESIACLRNRNWISDLINQKTTIKVLKKKDRIVGFMAYKIHEDTANLILGGVQEKYRHLSYGFWANVLLGLKDVKEIKTLISSSNTDVVNLYTYFGFQFSNPQFGFHKHL